jgi:3-methyl-2-oxobutanoate hydroxymethyltransferase
MHENPTYIIFLPPNVMHISSSLPKGDMMRSIDFITKKQSGEKITMVTCYESWSATLLSDTGVDCLLVGDSAAMVIHGHTDTLQADIPMISSHTRAVRRGSPDSFIIADMPFLSCRRGLEQAVSDAGELMRSGANAVKIEGVTGHEQIISHIVESGIPVMGHLGLTPQAVHQLGGYRVQGRKEDQQTRILEQAKAVERSGCFALVLECVPSSLAQRISQELTIPVIGIGAGPAVDGQVLVLHDLIGLTRGHLPKFVRTFTSGQEWFAKALQEFVSEVRSGNFPAEEESYR